MIRALACPKVFACHCEVDEETIAVGVLILDIDWEPGEYLLYNLDDESERYRVFIPPIETPVYDIELSRVDE